MPQVAGFLPIALRPCRAVSVDKGGNCLSGGRTTHLMFKHIEFIHKSWSADHKASCSPATDKPPGRGLSGAGLDSFATFLDGLLKNQISPIF